MKNLKNLLPVFALMLGFMLVFTQSAFKASSSKTPVEYQYISNSSLEASMQNIENWEVADEETPVCTEGTAKPCRYIHDGDFDTFLQGSSKQDLIDNAESTKL